MKRKPKPHKSDEEQKISEWLRNPEDEAAAEAFVYAEAEWLRQQWSRRRLLRDETHEPLETRVVPLPPWVHIFNPW